MSPINHTRVKVCGMTREEDVIKASDVGVDAIGFIFYQKSERFISLDKAQKLSKLVKPFVTTVAVVVNESSDVIEEIISRVKVDVLQFHGDESNEYCASFKHPFYKALRIKKGSTAEQLVEEIQQYPDASAILLDTYKSTDYGGTGEVFDWSILHKAKPMIKKKIILAGGLSLDNVNDAIDLISPYAVDINSGIETAPGIKNHDNLSQIIAQVKQKHSC